MKHVPFITTADILHKIENIEKEVMDLKLSILKDLSPSGKKVISLKGILKGVNITEQEIASAKKISLQQHKNVGYFFSSFSSQHSPYNQKVII